MALAAVMTAAAQSPQQQAAIDKQRISVDRQRTSVKQQLKGAATSPFFTVPWTSERSLRTSPANPGCRPVGRSELDPAVAEAARKNALTPDLLRAVIKRESAWNPCAVSEHGAMGLMQIMPGTASDLGLDKPFDPIQNIDAGSRYLKELLDRYGGDLVKALAGYNAGPGRVDAADGIPPIRETQDYVREILKQLDQD